MEERVVEQPVTHIRKAVDHETLKVTTFCGQEGETISYRHYIEQPDHVASLKMCRNCVDEASRWTDRG